jgi:hypothetical protein
MVQLNSHCHGDTGVPVRHNCVVCSTMEVEDVLFAAFLCFEVLCAAGSAKYPKVDRTSVH